MSQEKQAQEQRNSGAESFWSPSERQIFGADGFGLWSLQLDPPDYWAHPETSKLFFGEVRPPRDVIPNVFGVAGLNGFVEAVQLLTDEAWDAPRDFESGSLEMRMCQVRDGQGVVLGAKGWIRRRATPAREDHQDIEKERLRSLMDQSHAAIWCQEFTTPIDISLPEDVIAQRMTDFVIADANDNAARMLNRVLAVNIIGRHISEIFTVDTTRLQAQYDLIRNNFRVENAETVIRKEDDTEYWLHNAYGVVKDNALERVWVVSRNITPEKKLREEARHAQRMDTVGRLTASVAHDFNNLLTIILGNSQLLRARYNLDGEAAQLTGAVVSATERAASLVRRLLLFSRGQATELRELDAVRDVLGLRELLKGLTGTRCPVRFVTPEEELRVFMDAVHLEQIVVNLVVNARDAMIKGGEIVVSLESFRIGDKESQELALAWGEYVLLKVADHGEGISKEHRHLVFDAFFTTKERGMGTGLGLSTVRDIVEESKGTITFDTTPGVGTTFNVYLPRVRNSKDRVLIHDQRLRSFTGTECVHIVSSSTEMRLRLADMLSPLGYQCVLMKTWNIDAKQAWKTAHGHPDAAIVDENISDAAHLAIRLQEDRRFRLPVLRILGAGSPVEGEASRPDGRTQVSLAQPFDDAALAGTLRALIDRQSVESDSSI